MSAVSEMEVLRSLDILELVQVRDQRITFNEFQAAQELLATQV